MFLRIYYAKKGDISNDVLKIIKNSLGFFVHFNNVAQLIWIISVYFINCLVFVSSSTKLLSIDSCVNSIVPLSRRESFLELNFLQCLLKMDGKTNFVTWEKYRDPKKSLLDWFVLNIILFQSSVSNVVKCSWYPKPFLRRSFLLVFFE